MTPCDFAKRGNIWDCPTLDARLAGHEPNNTTLGLSRILFRDSPSRAMIRNSRLPHVCGQQTSDVLAFTGRHFTIRNKAGIFSRGIGHYLPDGRI